MKAPVLGLYGEADQGIPVAQVEAMKAALAGRRQDRGVQDLSRRAARLPRRLPAELSQEAAEDAWGEMQSWFKKYKVLG